MQGVGISFLAQYDRELASLRPDILQKLEIEIKYQGYLERQQREIERFDRVERELIPAAFDYRVCKGLKAEALEKLLRVRPATVAQASRISGVTPGDIAVLLVYLKRFSGTVAPVN